MLETPANKHPFASASKKQPHAVKVKTHKTTDVSRANVIYILGLVYKA